MSQGIENVFRPPYELATVAASLLAAAGVLSRPAMFMLSPWQAVAGATALVALAGWRLSQARRAMAHRSAVRTLQPYALFPHEVPWSRNSVFLGKGFEWTSRHTQRMVVLAQPENEGLLAQSALYRWARSLERRPDAPAWLTRMTSRDHPLNPARPLPPVGGNPALHGVEIEEIDIYTALAELKVDVTVPSDVPLLGIKAGKIDIQRFIYWNVAKMFWNPDLTFEENHHINFDWYHPRYAHRQTEAEVRQWCGEAGLTVTYLKEEEAGLTVRANKN